MAERRLVVEICSSDDAILSEYVAMREELMFFVDSQRKSINFMMSVVFGQAGILLLHQDVVVHLARYISLFYLFGLPLVIFSLMLTTLEFTAKILFVADFIHHDVRARYLSKHRLETGFFEWEIYKRNSKRVNKYLMIALDLSKWLIYLFGFVLSFGISVWTSQLGGIEINVPLYTLAGIFDFIMILIVFVISMKFNEAKGEALLDQVGL